MAIKSETVEAFIAGVEKELADIPRRKAELEKRKVELEEIIKKCKALFGEDQRQQSLPLSIPITTQPISRVRVDLKSLRRERGKKIWEQIVDLLKEVGTDLSISNIVQGFRDHGWPMSAKNASKIVYRALRDKPEIFINTHYGTWNLKERTEKKEQS